MASTREGPAPTSRKSGPVLAAMSVFTALVVGFVAAINLAVPSTQSSNNQHPDPQEPAS